MKGVLHRCGDLFCFVLENRSRPSTVKEEGVLQGQDLEEEETHQSFIFFMS